MCYLRASGSWHKLSEEGILSSRSGGPGGPASYSCLHGQKTEGGVSNRTEQNQLLPPATTATKGYLYTTKGCCSQQDTLLGLSAQKDWEIRLNPPNYPLLAPDPLKQPLQQTPGQAWAASAALARDRHHLPACSFTQWHKRMKTALQERLHPSFFLSLYDYFFLNTQLFFWKETLQNFTSLRRHEFTSQDPPDSLFDRHPSLFSPFRSAWLDGL